jgi:hypothetical protein
MKARKSNSEIRQWYLQELARIPNLDMTWKEQGHSPKERAKKAFSHRHQTRLRAREMMNPIDAALLRAADIVRYGRPGGPTFDDLVKQSARKGLRGDEIYEDIIVSSYRTNPRINRRFGS